MIKTKKPRSLLFASYGPCEVETKSPFHLLSIYLHKAQVQFDNFESLGCRIKRKLQPVCSEMVVLDILNLENSASVACIIIKSPFYDLFFDLQTLKSFLFIITL